MLHSEFRLFHHGKHSQTFGVSYLSDIWSFRHGNNQIFWRNLNDLKMVQFLLFNHWARFAYGLFPAVNIFLFVNMKIEDNITFLLDDICCLVIDEEQKAEVKNVTTGKNWRIFHYKMQSWWLEDPWSRQHKALFRHLWVYILPVD